MKEKLNISVTDIDLYRNHIYNKDKLKSLDVNSRFKIFRFFYNGLLINLENITVRAYMIKPDKKEIFNDLSIVNGNIAELEFTNQALLVPGTLKLELVLYEDDAELSSFLIEYEVVKSLRTDNSIESSNEYTSLQISLQKIELWNKNYQKLYDKWNTDFSNLHSTKSDILDKLKSTKENELNKLKEDKYNELTTLYNSKDEELNNLKNTWDEEFRKKYDGLNREYSNRVSIIEEDINSVKKEGLNLKDSLEKDYLNISKGDIFNFNEANSSGRYSVGSGTTLPGAPFPNAIYGSLIVLPRRGNEIQQIFLTLDGYIFSRFFDYLGTWSNWYRIPKLDDFESNNGETYGFQKLPNGIIIQWGSTVIPFDRYRAHGYLYYPIAFKEYVHCCGNVAANNYGGFCETSGTVVGDTLVRGYAEALDIGNGNKQGYNVRFQWIAIGK